MKVWHPGTEWNYLIGKYILRLFLLTSIHITVTSVKESSELAFSLGRETQMKIEGIALGFIIILANRPCLSQYKFTHPITNSKFQITWETGKLPRKCARGFIEHIYVFIFLLLESDSAHGDPIWCQGSEPWSSTYKTNVLPAVYINISGSIFQYPRTYKVNCPWEYNFCHSTLIYVLEVRLLHALETFCIGHCTRVFHYSLLARYNHLNR